MSERDRFAYKGKEFVYLTFGDWKWRFLRKGREKEFDYVVYIGKRHFDEPELSSVPKTSIPHGDYRLWVQRFDSLIDSSMEFLEFPKMEVRIAIICDEIQCLFWRILKQTARTLFLMAKYDGINELIRSAGREGFVWCNERNLGCGNCYGKMMGLYGLRAPIIVPIDACLYTLKRDRLSDVVNAWYRALLDEDKAFDEVVAELICNV